MVGENPVKRKLAEGQAVWGAASGVFDELANQLTISAGFDFLWIDTEHSGLGLESVRMLPVMARQRGCMPLIRVSGLDSGEIKRALDLGASGVMVPQVDTAAEAEAVVRAAKYAPRGNRGVSPMWTFHLGVSWEEYLPKANDEVLVVVQIESMEGMRNAEAIAAVDGVDIVFAGPLDLSASLDMIGQTRHEAVREQVAALPAAARRAGKVAGISVGGAEAALECHRLGYRFINIGNLIFAGAQALRGELDRVRAGA